MDHTLDTCGDTQKLIDSIIHGDLDSLINHLSSGFNISCIIDATGNTLLHLACSYNQVNIVKYLIEEGINPYIKNKNGHTPLHIACSNGHIETIYLLSKNNINNFDDLDFKGRNSLILACTDNKHLSVIHFIILMGHIDLNHSDNDGLTALHISSMSRSYHLVEYLLNHGADPYKQDSFGRTPLHYSAKNGDYLTTMILCQHTKSADFLNIVDSSNKKAYQLAYEDRNIQKWLLDHEYHVKHCNLSERKKYLMWFIIPFIIFLTYLIIDHFALNIYYMIFFIGIEAAIFYYFMKPYYLPYRDSKSFIFSFALTSWWTCTFIFFKYDSVQFFKNYPIFTFFVFIYHFVLLYKLIRLSRSDPGIVKVNKAQDDKVFLQELDQGISPPPICSKCLIRKPLRSKHCNNIGKCVISYDHYCVWVNNTIGINNRLDFIITISMLCALQFVSIPFYYKTINSIASNGTDIFHWTDAFLMLRNYPALVLCFIYQPLISLWEFHLIITQLYLVAKNLTLFEVTNHSRQRFLTKIVENDQTYYVNKFDRGIMQNIKDFFNRSKMNQYYNLYHFPKHMDPMDTIDVV